MWRRLRLVGALVVVGLAAFVLVPVPASQQALEAATARAFDAPFPSFCSGADPGDHECSVSDAQGSGDSPYALVVGEHGCWTAELSGPQGGEVPMPERAQGCVTAYDHLVAREPLLLALPF